MVAEPKLVAGEWESSRGPSQSPATGLPTCGNTLRLEPLLSGPSPPQLTQFRMRVVGWNVGGTDLVELPKAVREALGDPLRKQDIVLIQELPREREGWNYMPLAGRRVVSHRREGQWRGTGIWYDMASWCLLHKVHSSKRVWFKVRHLEAPVELWVGTAHFTPGCLPPSSQKVVFQGDVNTGSQWANEGDAATAVPKEGKGGMLHRILTERDFEMGIPGPDQWSTPTSRPRQEGRQGQCIDVACSKGLRCSKFYIHEESYMKLGTDHEMCHSEFDLNTKQSRVRHSTGPRVWIGGIDQVNHMDQDHIEYLADRCTRPAPGQGYRDTAEIKQAFRAAKRSGSSALWKQALKLRKAARRAWEQDRVVKASQGDWHSFRALKPRRQEGWDVGFAEAQEGDPHAAVHDHLAEVYHGREVEGVAGPWPGDVVAFTAKKLHKGVSQMKRGKSVGVDRTSTELVVGLLEVEEKSISSNGLTGYWPPSASQSSGTSLSSSCSPKYELPRRRKSSDRLPWGRE